ncbi:cysteine hydrolase family protein [Streptomyces sp. NPDC056161]|uniref:cysteine hydrolase family protein n=1 Tax=Streptomyces sp. NPDC056161 TaxID=3345732 RepID=UPI0035D62F45
MSQTYDPRHTAVLLVDPYNDFLSEGGKIWPHLEPMAEAVGLLDHLRSVVASAREAGVRVMFVPHRRWEAGDYETWDHPNPTQRTIMERHSFARGTWGGEFHSDFQPQPGDIVVQEHWAQSGSPPSSVRAASFSRPSTPRSRTACPRRAWITGCRRWPWAPW